MTLFTPGVSRVKLYTAEFAADPHHSYQEMHNSGSPLVPVELAPGINATMAVHYSAALKILHDPEHFPADPRRWQQKIPSAEPILAMLGYYPSTRFCDGPEHKRVRQPIKAAIERVDPNRLHAEVEDAALSLIESFSENGTADLLYDYSFPLVFRVLNRLMGCPADLAGEIAEGMRLRFDAQGGESVRGANRAKTAFEQFAAAKRRHLGNDIASAMILHPHNLNAPELVGAFMSCYGAGIQPLVNLITNTLCRTMLDDRFGGEVLDGSMLVRDALDEELFYDPSMRAFCARYPTTPILFDDVWLPVDEPILIGITACNNDPRIQGDRTGNRAHVAWGAGPHMCPATSIAYLIAQDAVEQLLDVLPDIQPASEPMWRAGSFQRALEGLRVTFPPYTMPPRIPPPPILPVAQSSTEA
ncbi:cytochrome P450 [Nocardia miyunensis]|uniref:cytochrome P450 n=1 Tax=Nocardia miyunensis TaxID=282684 RepID=UPI000835A81D|nr:cytochrome P450 [Nocardia miyunensis]